MPVSLRFFKSKTVIDGKEVERDMVELKHDADKNSVIVPADQAHKDQYPQEWAKFERTAGASEGHNASAQTTDIPERSVRADNPANDQVLQKSKEKDKDKREDRK